MGNVALVWPDGSLVALACEAGVGVNAGEGEGRMEGRREGRGGEVRLGAI